MSVSKKEQFWCNSFFRHGAVDRLVCSRLPERRSDPHPPPVPWVALIPEVLRQVPAVCYDGVLVLVPHGSISALQLLVSCIPLVTELTPAENIMAQTSR